MGSWVTNQTKKGWLTSIFELGAWFGCLYSGFFAEILSRKYSIILNVGVFVVGVVIQCCTIVAGPVCLIVGRFITGSNLYSGDGYLMTDIGSRSRRRGDQCQCSQLQC